MSRPKPPVILNTLIRRITRVTDSKVKPRGVFIKANLNLKTSNVITNYPGSNIRKFFFNPGQRIRKKLNSFLKLKTLKLIN